AEQNARQALGKVLDTDDPGAKIVALLDKSITHIKPGETFTYEQDIAPWLGEKVGLFATSFAEGSDPTILIESTNDAAAMASERKDSRDLGPAGSYKGHQYDKDTDGRVFGTAGGFAIYGPLAGFQQAVDAMNGESLGDSDDFKDAIGDLPDDRLGTFYTIPKTLISAIGEGQIDPSSQALLEKSAGESLDKPISGALTASPNSFDLEFVGGDNGVETPESALLGDVPAQSWLALGIGDLGDVAKRSLDQLKGQIPNYDEAVRQIESTTGSSLDQLTDAFGDAALYVEGTTESTLTGALVVQAKDPDLTGRLLSQLQGLLQIGSSGGVRPLKLSGGGTGFEINDPSVAPAPIEIAQQADKLVIGYGPNSAERTLTPTDTLADSQPFSSAKGQVSDLGTDFFLDFPSVFQLAESSGAESDPDYVKARKYIDALSYLVSGSGTQDDQTELKAVLGLK
ncbi:MAG TPA: DUF3352 domain-containing protein, partial [Solirubrobacterales bacterium]|nr:DUF3352 domain-containing protein [Solirubrobacterales bacterium]